MTERVRASLRNPMRDIPEAPEVLDRGHSQRGGADVVQPRAAQTFGHDFRRVSVTSEPTIQRDDDDDALPTPQPFKNGPLGPLGPLGPFNFGAMPGSSPGGRLGFGAPLTPMLPDSGDLDPRTPRPLPTLPIPGDTRGGDDPPQPTSPFGFGFQGQYGDDGWGVAGGLRWTF